MIYQLLGFVSTTVFLTVTIPLPGEGLEGAIIKAGLITASLAGIWKTVGKPMLRPVLRWFNEHNAVTDDRLRNIERAVTGDPEARELLPVDERHKPLADIVIAHHIKTEPLIEQFVKEHEKP